jgi:hypothetical protein
MHIGIDFDNTIADYSVAFYQVAKKLNWIPIHTGQSKSAVKEYFINQDIEPKWTELQGIVYGKEIHQAKPYKGCLAAMIKLKKAGHSISIISHKTKYPIIGNKVNFHKAAINWLKENGIITTSAASISVENVYFNQTKDEKIKCIADLKCDVFIDDLENIFSHSLFPTNCKKILFNPNKLQTITFKEQQIDTWNNVEHII